MRLLMIVLGMLAAWWPHQVVAFGVGHGNSTDAGLLIRKSLFWVADKEQADAWLKLHTPPQ